jgi:hypothetical protein
MGIQLARLRRLERTERMSREHLYVFFVSPQNLLTLATRDDDVIRPWFFPKLREF